MAIGGGSSAGRLVYTHHCADYDVFLRRTAGNTYDMEENMPALKTQLLSEIVPRLVADGEFGEGMVVSKADASPMGGLREDHWASSTFALEVEVCAESDKDRASPKTFSLVAKFVTVNVGYSEFSELEKMAMTEVAMYSLVFPYFRELWKEFGDGSDGPLTLLPKCYLTETGDVSIIVMENMKAQGFRLATERVGLDKNHVYMVLRNIGRFHALSYAAKLRREEDFLGLTEALQEGVYTERTREKYERLLPRSVLRGVDRLAEREGAVDPETLGRVRERLKDPVSVMFNCVRSKGPLAVIAHGDFLRNNIFFKYDGKTENPVDIRFFDFQTSRYCSPAVDLTLFILFNTTPELRANHWDDMFAEYYEGLRSTMTILLSSGPNPIPITEIPSLSALRSEFDRHILYGYTICSFFIPMMAVKDVEPLPAGYEEVDHTELVLRAGGDKGTELLADFVQELIQLGVL